ncbi:hypothetical protein WMY93_026286 [Mugilogobius chulae]|uniref:VWFD domain-containing protein n=1 Tax=Mugilogobius chulae TaxID=88201 RepID=A0AAW0N1B7_9GOBI
MDNCGCEHNGRYLTVGETVVDPHCNSKCVCQASGTVKCDKLHCGSSEVCEVRDGVRGCYGKQGQCVITRRPPSSFDGMTGPMDAVGHMRLVVDMRSCRKGSQSVEIIHVFFKNNTITVNRQHDVWINGRKVSLPGKVGCDISVYMSDRSVVIQRSSALRVTYSITQEVTVIVDTSLSYKMCGACGNYNHNSKDDMTTADGKVVSHVSEVVNSWKAGDFSSCDL